MEIRWLSRKTQVLKNVTANQILPVNDLQWHAVFEKARLALILSAFQLRQSVQHIGDLTFHS